MNLINKLIYKEISNYFIGVKKRDKKQDDFISYKCVANRINVEYDFILLKKCKMTVQQKKDFAELLLYDCLGGKDLQLVFFDEEITAKNTPKIENTYNLISLLSDGRYLTEEHRLFYDFLVGYFKKILINTQFYYVD